MASTTTNPSPASIERAPKPTRTKRGVGLGAKLAMDVYYYRAPDGVAPDYGTFAGRDDDGRWELHFEGPVELEKQLGRITAALSDVAEQAREENEDERASGRTVWLKAIGAQGLPADERWWNDHDRGQWIDFPYRPRSVKQGDMLVIYAAGTGKVVGVVRVTSATWYEGGNRQRWPYRLDVEVVKAVPVTEGIELASLSNEREIGKSIRQKSHVRLSDAEAANALKSFGIS